MNVLSRIFTAAVTPQYLLENSEVQSSLLNILRSLQFPYQIKNVQYICWKIMPRFGSA